VKLLFDENPSPELADLLADVYPGSVHVHACGLARSSDDEIWEYAKANGFTIVSRDSDIEERGVLRGSPPKFIGCGPPTLAAPKSPPSCALQSPWFKRSWRVGRKPASSSPGGDA
jgi:hypothetical protein